MLIYIFFGGRPVLPFGTGGHPRSCVPRPRKIPPPLLEGLEFFQVQSHFRGGKLGVFLSSRAYMEGGGIQTLRKNGGNMTKYEGKMKKYEGKIKKYENEEKLKKYMFLYI